jgi:hypothetical protein
MKRAHAVFLIATSVLLVASLTAYHARAQVDDSRTKSSVWMKQKLIASQNILEGLTRADYDMIEKNAAGMQIVAYLENWVRADTPGYKGQLQAFEYANGAIVRAAHDKNLDGVTLAYTQLAISCVQCHKLVRDKPSP